MKKLTSIKMQVSKLTLEELAEIEKYCRKRRKALVDRRVNQQKEEAWNRVKDLPEGAKVYVTSPGIMVGSKIQRGDFLYVWWIQPRKKLAWLTDVDEKKNWKLAKKNARPFTPGNLRSYGISPEPPEKPASEFERETARQMGEVLSDGAKRILSE